jgi:hypothetical protein
MAPADAARGCREPGRSDEALGSLAIGHISPSAVGQLLYTILDIDIYDVEDAPDSSSFGYEHMFY